MKIQVNIPNALRQYTQDYNKIELSGSSVEGVLEGLITKFPMLKKHLFNEGGELRNFVNIYVNEDDIRYLKNLATTLNEGDVITIVPSVAGGNEETMQLTEEINLDTDEVQRYSRHILIPEVGFDGQKKLKQASVLLVGLGGLGSPLAMYLSAAGIGKLGLVDADVVDYTNLQRQVIHSTGNVGNSKIESAKKRIQEINPNVNVESYETYLNSENAYDICTPYDIIIDGTDNFATRYLVNDVSVLLGKPNVYGSIFRFDGQASVFYAKEGPCYRCLYPEPPPPGLVPSCAEGGVLGVLPGIIGLIQATEAVKIILGKGDSLIGRLLVFDALTMKFKELKLRRNPTCPICSENAVIKELIDYEEFCGINEYNQADFLDPEFEISARELKEKLETGSRPVQLIDVRQPQEYAICHLPKTNLIPLNTLEYSLHNLDRDEDIVVYCRVGARSAQAVKFMHEAGFKNVKNLTGGILSWADEVDPTLPKY